jgi:hypothetical protein
MADAQTSEENAKLASRNVGHEILYGDKISKDEQLSIRPLLRETKHSNVEDSNVTIHILFYGYNS